jgi:hypothetical protein
MVKRMVIIAFIVVGSGLLLLVGFFTFTRGLGLPVRYEIPPGYKGWILHRDRDPLCPPTGRHGLFWVIKVGQDGNACTSAPLKKKWRYYRFDYVGTDGSRIKVDAPWGHSLSRSHTQTLGPGAHTYVSTAEDELGMAWFIGTEAELKQSGYSYSPTKKQD